MQRRALARYSTPLLLAVTLGLAFGVALGVALAVRLPAAGEFNAISWELQHVPNKWLYLTGRFFRGGLTAEEENARLASYLALTGQVQQLERAVAGGDETQRAELQRLRRQRNALENDAEAIIEGRLTSVLRDAGLESSLPLFPQARWVFPPVDVELDPPPREVVVSRRDKIELVAQRPLRAGLTLDDAVGVEQSVERDGTRSALVVPLSGAATYPSIVGPEGDYQSLVSTIAHEWVHHYLAFKPLGVRFYDSVELRTLNETVADLAGQELGTLLVEGYPLVPAPAEPTPTPEPAAVDVGAVLAQLRYDVDALLAGGKVSEAEALMEQRRKELAAQGVVFRRINQAFFAFYGLYANSPGAVDPVGAKVQELRRQAESIGAFLRAASKLTGARDLDRRLGAATAGAGTAR